MHQAYSALKAKDLGWSTVESSIRDAKNLTELNVALKSFETRSRCLKSSTPWKVSQSLEVMFQLLKAKYTADPKFRSFCEKLGKKVPCEGTVNKYWACGVDLQIMHSLDPQLLQELIMGHNTLGWLIKIVHTQMTAEEGYAWMDDVLKSSFFSVPMKCGLRNVAQLLKINHSGLLLDEEKVSWEQDTQIKVHKDEVVSEESSPTTKRGGGSSCKETQDEGGEERKKEV